jgi:hypothetical protein
MEDEITEDEERAIFLQKHIAPDDIYTFAGNMWLMAMVLTMKLSESEEFIEIFKSESPVKVSIEWLLKLSHVFIDHQKQQKKQKQP